MFLYEHKPLKKAQIKLSKWFFAHTYIHAKAGFNVRSGIQEEYFGKQVQL